MCGQVLDTVSSFKYLGMALDSDLNFSKHVNDYIKTVSYKVHQLAKICKLFNVRRNVLFYKSMILPRIDYGDIIYEPATTVEVNLKKFRIKHYG